VRLSLAKKILLQLAIAAGAFVMITPFLYMVSTALIEYAYTIPFPPRLIPQHPTFENFVRAWTSNNFGLYFMNSVIITASVILGVLAVCSLMGYGFARFQFPGKEFLFRILIFSLMVPGIIYLIPAFIVLRDLLLLDKRIGVVTILVAGSVAGTTFLFRSFFEGLPKELEEAVRIDGGGRWTIYRHVVLPLSQPVMATVAIMSYLGAWDDFFWTAILIKDSTKWTLPYGIKLFQTMHTTNWSLVFAASLIAMVPSIALFIAGQKYFISGLSAGGIKG